MKRETFLKIGSVISSILMFVGKYAQALPYKDSETRTAKKEHTLKQFSDEDRKGVFKKTHINCLPTQEVEHIELFGDALWTMNCANQVAEFEWKGIEAWSTWVDPSFLRSKGVPDTCALYCRPIEMPGGKALWIAFAPKKYEQKSIRDELFGRVL